jgi:hypothetical protein
MKKTLTKKVGVFFTQTKKRKERTDVKLLDFLKPSTSDLQYAATEQNISFLLLKSMFFDEFPNFILSFTGACVIITP